MIPPLLIELVEGGGVNWWWWGGGGHLGGGQPVLSLRPHVPFK